MSQLPKYGGQKASNVVKMTTTKTTRVAGTNTTQTESKTVIADVIPCGESQFSIRGVPRPGPSSLRQPTSSGIRAPARVQQGASRQLACTAATCPAGPRTSMKSTGQPQVLLQGLPRPAPAQRPTIQQPRVGGLQQSQAERVQRPVAGGLQQPRQLALQQPRQTGLQQPRQTGLQQPRQTGLQQPRQTGLQQPRPASLLQPSVAALPQPRPAALQQPKPSRLMRPSSSGLQQPKPARVQMAAPAASSTPYGSEYLRNLPPETPVMERREIAVPGAPPRRHESTLDSDEILPLESKYKIKPVALLKRPAPKASERATFALANKSMRRVGEKVTARAATIAPIQPQFIDTPEGKEMILKQTLLEKRVERDEEGEKIMKNLQIIDTDKRGRPKMIEMNVQQLDPRYPLAEGKEVISIASKVSLSESYTTVARDASRAITKTIPHIPPEEVAKLVEEENEDVDNTLKMLPPDLALSPGKYEVKKRLQHLQLNSESVALLEQSIIRPEPRADEAQNEPTPEIMAAMMHTVEKGVPPQSTPDQVFNTLFVETSNERYIKLCPVIQGPLQDVVVPTEVPQDVHKEVITDEMEKLTEKLQNIPTAAELPVLDIFDRIMTEDKKSPSKGKNKEIPFPLITDEKSLWVNANLEHLVNIVGATPVEVLDPASLKELEASGTLEEHMAAGVEYYVEADPVQYMSRVQLRGTQLPSYFPGYMLALPEFPDVVKLASGPDEVFASAWKSAQPKYFPDDSLQTLIF